MGGGSNQIGFQSVSQSVRQSGTTPIELLVGAKNIVIYYIGSVITKNRMEDFTKVISILTIQNNLFII